MPILWTSIERALNLISSSLSSEGLDFENVWSQTFEGSQSSDCVACLQQLSAPKASARYRLLSPVERKDFNALERSFDVVYLFYATLTRIFGEKIILGREMDDWEDLLRRANADPDLRPTSNPFFLRLLDLRQRALRISPKVAPIYLSGSNRAMNEEDEKFGTSELSRAVHLVSERYSISQIQLSRCTEGLRNWIVRGGPANLDTETMWEIARRIEEAIKAPKAQLPLMLIARANRIASIPSMKIAFASQHQQRIRFWAFFILSAFSFVSSEFLELEKLLQDPVPDRERHIYRSTDNMFVRASADRSRCILAPTKPVVARSRPRAVLGGGSDRRIRFSDEKEEPSSQEDE